MGKHAYFTTKGRTTNDSLKYGIENSGYTKLAKELADKYGLEERGYGKLKSFFLNNEAAADYTELTIIRLFELAEMNKISRIDIIKIIYNFLNKLFLPTPKLLDKKIELFTSNKENTVEGVLWTPYIFQNIISVELLEVLRLLSIKASGEVRLSDIENLIKAGISVSPDEILAKIGILLKLKISWNDLISNKNIFKDNISVETLHLIASQLSSMDTKITLNRILEIANIMKENVSSNPVEGSILIPSKLKMTILFASSSIGYARQK